MTKKHIFLITLIINISILFLSLGFASFSTTLSIDNIEVAIKLEKDIRITDFYSISETNPSSYNVDSVHTKLYLPNPDSEVTYKVDITNISPYALQIENIEIYPSNITYEISDYELKDNLCDDDKQDNKCNMGVKKSLYITFKYKENGYDSTNELGEYNVDANFTWGYNYKVVFHSNYQDDNLEDEEKTQLIPYNTSTPLELNTFSKEGFVFSKWSTNPSGPGLTYSNGRFVKDLSTDGTIVNLYAVWKIPQEEIYYEDECIFNGQGQSIEGNCAEGTNYDYINTGIALFSEENYLKSFLISFKITDVDDERFSSNERDTIVNSLYENNDKIAGRFPGFLLRIENGKWQLQGGNGNAAGTKVLFNKDDLVNKEIRLIRYNDGTTIKLYYLIDDRGPYLLSDLTNLYANFDTPLTFGASLEIDNTTVYRHSIATVNDITFKFLDDDLTLTEIITGQEQHQTEELTTLFAYSGPCQFNGSNANMSGDTCQDYSSEKFINTNIGLFNSENYQKDFILSFDIDEYSTSQESDQVTLMNSFRERTGLGYGVLLRRNKNNLQLLFRDGNGREKNLTISADTTSIKIIRNDNIACYSLNGGPLKFAISYENFTDPFNVPVTFGGAIDKTDNPFRYIQGSLSNMSIQVGEITDPDLTCPTS